MTWQLAYALTVVLAAALIALLICTHTGTCHEVLPQMITLLATAMGGTFALATAEIRARRKRHTTRSGEHDGRSDAG